MSPEDERGEVLALVEVAGEAISAHWCFETRATVDAHMATVADITNAITAGIVDYVPSGEPFSLTLFITGLRVDTRTLRAAADADRGHPYNRYRGALLWSRVAGKRKGGNGRGQA